MQLITNKTKTDKDHRMEFTAKEVRNFIVPRFGYMPKGKTFKMVKFPNKPGVKLYYKIIDGETMVGIYEEGFGVPEKFYSKSELTVNPNKAI